MTLPASILATARRLGLALAACSAACGPVLEKPTPAATVAGEQAAYLEQAYRIRPGDALEVKHHAGVDVSVDIADAIAHLYRLGLGQIVTVLAGADAEASVHLLTAGETRRLVAAAGHRPLACRSLHAARVFAGDTQIHKGARDVIWRFGTMC